MKKIILLWVGLIIGLWILAHLSHSYWYKFHIERIVKNDSIRIEKNYDYHWGRKASPQEEKLRIISNTFGSIFLLSIPLSISHILFKFVKKKKKNKARENIH